MATTPTELPFDPIEAPITCIAETHTDDGALLAISRVDEDYRIIEVLYNAPEPDATKDTLVTRDIQGRVSTIVQRDKATGGSQVLYRAGAVRTQPAPADTGSPPRY